MRAAAVARSARSAIHEARARPWHVGFAGAVAGLAAAPISPAPFVAGIVLLPFLGRGAATRLAIVAAVLLGGVVGQARVHAIDATHLTARLGHAVRERVILLETPRRRAFGAHVATVRLDGERVLVRTPSGVRWPTERIGAILEVRGGLEPLPEADRWMRARGVHALVRADALIATHAVRGGLAGRIDAARARAQRALRTGVPIAVGALLRGMVLGDDAALSDATRDEFRASGLSHLVAASGQNVMLLAALVLAAAAMFGLGLRTRLVLALAAMALYVPLAGDGPSIQRAGVMGAAGIAAVMAGRPPARWYALLLATAATLAMNPLAVHDVGWQLSFAAVVAILLLASRVRDGLHRRGVPPGLAEATALTVAATLGTAPLIAAHFGRVSIVSLVANVLAAPAVPAVMWLGMIAAAVGQVSAVVAMPFTALAGFPVAYIMWVGQAASGVPWAQARAPVLAVAGACAAAALALAVRGARRAVGVGCLCALAIAVGVSRLQQRALAAPAGLRITFLDVGQGDATLIQDRGAALLFDTGPPDGPVVTRLRRAGVRRLDLLVVTHAQADHDGGAAAVLSTMPVSLVLDGRDGVREPLGVRMAAVAAQRHVRMVTPRAGEVLRVGPVAVHVLWPAPASAQAKAGADPNLRAVVAEADADGVRTLLTADAESDVLDGLELNAVDVLKVSHHGSADAGLPALLARLRPRLAAIEVGRRNPYGHPAPSTVAALLRTGARVVRTDRDGSVRVEPAGGALRVQAHAL